MSTTIKILKSLLLILTSVTAFSQNTAQDSLTSYGKTYVVVAKERIPDTLVLEGVKYFAVPGTDLQPEKKVTGNLVIVTPADTSSKALNLKGKIYVAESEVVMADILRSNGKIYVVVAVLAVILAGFFAYLIATDRKIQKLKDSIK